MPENERRVMERDAAGPRPAGAPAQANVGPPVQELQVNNRALLAQYVEAATLAQERLLAYLSGVLGERGVVGQVRGWDVARGFIIVATEGEPAAGPDSLGEQTLAQRQVLG